jgi:hypothetical protein
MHICIIAPALTQNARNPCPGTRTNCNASVLLLYASATLPQRSHGNKFVTGGICKWKFTIRADNARTPRPGVWAVLEKLELYCTNSHHALLLGRSDLQRRDSACHIGQLHSQPGRRIRKSCSTRVVAQTCYIPARDIQYRRIATQRSLSHHLCATPALTTTCTGTMQLLMDRG